MMDASLACHRWPRALFGGPDGFLDEIGWTAIVHLFWSTFRLLGFRVDRLRAAEPYFDRETKTDRDIGQRENRAFDLNLDQAAIIRVIPASRWTHGWARDTGARKLAESRS
jgi:hypothetical protein